MKPVNRRRRSLSLIASFAVLAVTACGSSDDPVAVAPPEVLPGTTLVPDRLVLDEPLVSVVPVVVAERCPVSATDIAGEQGDMLAESSRLEPMLGQVVAYGGQHPDEFVTYGLVWHGPGDASLFASFVSNLDAHRSALNAEVDYPDDLIICQAGASAEDVLAIEATLLEELRGRYLGIGRGANGLEVSLMAGEEMLAAELDARYGDAITLMVGELAYPIEDAVSNCAEPPVPNSLDGLDIAIVPPAGPTSTAGLMALNLTVTLTNTGDAPISFSSGSSQGVLLTAEGDAVSGAADMTLAGIGVALEPGESSELPVVVSTSSCNPALGFEIPAGDYDLVAGVFHSAGGTNMMLYSTPLSITIVN